MKKEALGVSEALVITCDYALVQNLQYQHYEKPATHPTLYCR